MTAAPSIGLDNDRPRAQRGVRLNTVTNRDFEDLTDPFRRELLAHCYRMLGSVQDAEDLVQETYLRAWRSFDQFEGRSSIRVWMYKIATMACLTALETRRRRLLPSDLAAPSHDAREALASAEPGIVWLQPIPDRLISESGNDPAAAASSQSGIRLAFIAALQSLSARQRAVLILRDVLCMRALLKWRRYSTPPPRRSTACFAGLELNSSSAGRPKTS